MAIYTQDQIRELARSVGFRKRAAHLASAIALCESEGNTDAIGDQSLATQKYGYSYGLWQIRSLRSEKGTGEHRDEDRLLDPEFNAASAKLIRGYAGWTAWSVFLNDGYKAYLQDPDHKPYWPAPKGTYVVVGNDTGYGIAAKHPGTTWLEWCIVNNRGVSDTLHVGDILIIPGGPKDATRL